jgi:hypothetical protein
VRHPHAPAPVSGFEDLLISILERGLVFVVRLGGVPGDRHLEFGLGLPESVDPMLLALGVTSGFRSPGYEPGWWQDETY